MHVRDLMTITGPRPLDTCLKLEDERQRDDERGQLLLTMLTYYAVGSSCRIHLESWTSANVMAGRVVAVKDANTALARYEHSLDDLTFNSKPLIDDLTRSAEQLEPKGDEIVEMIQRRIMKVASRRMKLAFSVFIFNSYSIAFLLLNHGYIHCFFYNILFIHCDKNFDHNCVANSKVTMIVHNFPPML